MVDVARRAGVSRALVSLVLSGKPGASPANRAKVLSAAAELGYAPDVNARRLREGTRRLVGVVFDGHDAFTARVLDAAHEAVAARGRDLVLTMSSSAPSSASSASVRLVRALRTLEAQRVSGILLISSGPVDAEAAALLSTVPAVFVGAYAPAHLAGRVASVHSDDEGGMRCLVRHLVDLGHRRMAVTRVAGRRSGDLRAQAVVDEARLLGAEVLEVPAAAYDESAGVAAGREVLGALDLDPAPTAVLAANDALALGIIHVLRGQGLRVPEDVSVTGFDDAGAGPAPAVASLGLTTVHQDVEGLISSALDLLEAPPRPGEAAELVLPTRLVLRSTTAAPAVPGSTDPMPS
ncbi:Glucose-resistance amylase regulator [Actinomyces howellii]|uniref:Glucose-resistance amylase regulator n=2 Tax=Actinomyces howellii TaxID=52771 RepID=A0A3S4RAG4_9ACTO|nr:Glucose-resistance amylase regulator [Actinomyces howellii]